MKKGIDLNKILRLCVVGLWILAVLGCDSSDTSSTVVDEVDNPSGNQAENKAGSKGSIDTVDAS